MKAGGSQVLGGLLANPEDITRTSEPVMSSAALSFFPRLDPCLVNLFHNFEPWEVLSGGADCGTGRGTSSNPVGDPGAEREVLLV